MFSYQKTGSLRVSAAEMGSRRRDFCRLDREAGIKVNKSLSTKPSMFHTCLVLAFCPCPRQALFSWREESKTEKAVLRASVMHESLAPPLTPDLNSRA